MKMSDASHKNYPLFSPQLYDTSFGRPPQMFLHEFHTDIRPYLTLYVVGKRPLKLHHTWTGANTFGKNAVHYYYGSEALYPVPGYNHSLECNILQLDSITWNHNDKCAINVYRYMYNIRWATTVGRGQF